jgi:hypothetical protein
MLLRMALAQQTSRLTAVTAAVALAVAPMSRRLPQPQRARRSSAIPRPSNCCANTPAILRAAGLEKQNIQVVILNESGFNAFVADGRRIFVNYGALMQSNPEPDHRGAGA